MRVDMIESILQSGIQGVQGGLDQFGRAANNIATANNSGGANSQELASNLLEVKQAQVSVQSSIAVIKVADENIGTILNELA